MRIIVFLCAFAWSWAAFAEDSVTLSPEAGIHDIGYYKNRYQLLDAYTKRVDDKGNGFEPLYGTRNVRVILHGIAYRGGANNAYHKTKKRDNQNPLPDDGLMNLCQEGFSKAIYLYSTNFSTAPAVTSCVDEAAQQNKLNYVQWSPYSANDIQKIFTEIKMTLEDASKGPVYIHCWNGWHASGLASALILRQFCGVSGDQAVKYWDANTDGSNKEPSYENIRKTIRDFKPMTDFLVDASVQKEICPQL